MRLTRKGSTHSFLLTALLCLAALVLVLSGCAGIGVTTPTPTPTATINPLSVPVLIPSIDCDAALQLIQQKDVNLIDYSIDSMGLLAELDVYAINATKVGDYPIVPGQQTVQTDAHTAPTMQCLQQVLAAVKAVNKTLPANAQIIVKQSQASSE